MDTRVFKILRNEDINKISHTIKSWREGSSYKDIKGFCKSSTSKDIKKMDYILTPGRYVGFADDIDDEISFEEKFSKLKKDYFDLLKEGEILDDKIKKYFENYLK